MPAVVRGGRRDVSISQAAPKKTASASRRKIAQAPIPAGKLHALGALGLSEHWILAGLAALVLLGAGLLLFTNGRAQALTHAAGQVIDGRLATLGLKLDRVHLEGVSTEAAPDIKAALNLEKGQPITRLDLAALRQRVESVGWVKSARLLRLLPNTLIVAVQERDRLAVWQHGGHAAVIDSTGRLIKEADPARFADLPLVVGEGAAETASRILPLVRQRQRLAARVEALVRVDNRRWDIRLKDGALIQLPAQGEEAALLQFDQLDHRARVLDLGFKRIDLRDPRMAAVRLKDDAATAGTTGG